MQNQYIAEVLFGQDDFGPFQRHQQREPKLVRQLVEGDAAVGTRKRKRQRHLTLLHPQGRAALGFVRALCHLPRQMTGPHAQDRCPFAAGAFTGQPEIMRQDRLTESKNCQQPGCTAEIRDGRQ